MRSMSSAINFHNVFSLIREWFDSPTSKYDDFDTYRFSLYEEEDSGFRDRLPLKIWWPHYTEGDFRFEQIIGGLLVQQTSWRQVRAAIQAIDTHLKNNCEEFNAGGITGIPLNILEGLIRSTGFFRQKARRIHDFCTYIRDDFLDIESFFDHFKGRGDDLGVHLMGLGMGFGRETRDCILLYGANIPVFIADSYACQLLSVLGVVTNGKIGYDDCQRIFQVGIERDFDAAEYGAIMDGYTPEELRYALPAYPIDPEEGKDTARIGSVLLYQQYHAGIVELGRSKRWDEFREAVMSMT